MSPGHSNTVDPYTLHQPSTIAYKHMPKAQSKLEAFILSKNPSLSHEEAQTIAFWIQSYSKEEDMDPMLVAALINRESSFNSTAVSVTGAKGLGQIKDFNHESLGIQDPFDIKQNIRGTVRYLKHLSGVWKNNAQEKKMVLASYLQGPNATKKQKDRKLPTHVRNYIDDILTTYQSLTN